ncbi:MAG: Sir2 family NAD-dependent protein deacetylase, partial [Clostridium perfringens]|nr:Sir2 family NAD-dependent protein deacetylase [Clostridium perfringens]
MKTYLDNIKRIKELIDNVDYVLVGAGAGLSAAGGINYLDEKLAEKWFPEYKGLNLNSIAQIQSAFWDLTEDNVLAYWGYWSRHIYNIRYKIGATKPYLDLYKLLKDKEHFIITTNVDGQFEKAGFKKENIFAPQGEYAFFQCSKPCSNELYDNKEMINTMVENIEDKFYIREEDIPLCPKCGSFLVPNLRKDNFFVEKPHFKTLSAFNDFIEKAKGKNLVLLELGVGYNTPVIIKYPFENITLEYPKNTTLIRINLGENTV